MALRLVALLSEISFLLVGCVVHFDLLRQIAVHVFVEWEQGGSGTDLGTHVADGAHASGGEGVDTGS